MGTINELNTTDTLADDDKLVIWKDQAGATRAITAEDAATYFSLAGGPYQPLDELLTAIAGLGPSTAAGDFIELTAQDTVRVRKLSVATYAALTVIPASFRFDDMLVYVASRATDGDGGEGWWRFDAASSATANGGTILAPDTGTGRWFRQYAGATTPQWFDALSSTATALAALNSALTVAGVGGVVEPNAEINIGAAATTNPGATITGEKGVYFEAASGGRQLLNPVGRDASLFQWGRENLVRWLEGLRAGETLKVVLVGDSNTSGFVGSVLLAYLDSLPNVSVVNYGISGTTIEEWRTGTGPFAGSGKALSDVLTYDPDLMVMCWGTNDPAAGRTAADFSASLVSAMTTFRASLGINTCSVAILTPNAMGDTSDRDELWSLQIRPIIRAMSERFDCGFFDKNALFPNATIDLAAGAMQNKWLDSARVHTATLSTNILASMIAEWLAPREIWSLTWDNIASKAAADLATTYPPGVSITRMGDAQFDGFVLTANPVSTGGHFAFQINWSYTGTDRRFAFRTFVGGAWSTWQVNGPDPLVVVTSVAAGYAVTGGTAGLNTQRDSNLVSLSGRLTLSPAAQVIATTTLANIATVAHRPIFNIQDAVVVALNASGTVERLRADVTTTGDIVVRENSVMIDATTVSINLTYRGV